MVTSIMGLLMLTVFPALVSVRRANQLAMTQSNLRSLMLATATYVQANGCLPCPARPGGTGTQFGKVATATACGVCAAPQGIPPFASLGISASMARDGWGHWITMRVDPALANPIPLSVPPSAVCTSADVSSGVCAASQLGASAKGLCKTGLSQTGRISITSNGGGGTQKAAVVFISHGSEGYGSFVATPKLGDEYLLPFTSNYAACTAYGGYAQCNSAERDTAQYYDAPAVISDVDAYDDVLAYADRNALVSMLGNGACNTAW